MIMKFISKRTALPSEVIADELTRIYERDQKLTASAVVKEATPTTAPLHPAFLWDDKKAGEEYRLYQARTLIRRVSVIREDREPTKLFVNVPDQNAYHPVDVVVKKPDLYAAALNELSKRVRSAQAALDDLQRAAQQEPDSDKLARITIAVQAMQAAQAAVKALH